ncbi:MAG: aspartyl protease family protein [Planctomycetota bacterium]
MKWTDGLVSAGLVLVCSAVAGCSGGPGAVLLSKEDSARYAVADPTGLPDRLDIPLTRRGGYLLVPGYIDDQPVGLMMIDTGASISVIAQGAAGRLNLEKGGEGRTVGVGGFETFEFYKAGHYSIGQTTRGAPESGRQGVLRLASERLAGLKLLGFGESLRVGLGGIVGFPELSAVPFALDASRRELTVYRPEAFRPPAGATRERLRLFRKLPMVRAEVYDGSQRVEVWLLIDYGADNALTLPDVLLERHPGVMSVNATGRGRTAGVGGTVQSTQTWVKDFRMLGLSLKDVPVNFEPPPPTMRGPRLIGRVGNELLKHFRLTFHASHGWVYAQWIPGEAGADTPESVAGQPVK